LTTVDLPEPEAPTMKTNSPFSITNETPLSAPTSGSYTFSTLSKTIIAPTPEACAGSTGRSATIG